MLTRVVPRTTGATYRQRQPSASDFGCTCPHRSRSYCYSPRVGPWSRRRFQDARFVLALGVTYMPGSPLDYLGALRAVHDLLGALDDALARRASFARSFVWRVGDRGRQLVFIVRQGGDQYVVECMDNRNGSRTEQIHIRWRDILSARDPLDVSDGRTRGSYFLGIIEMILRGAPMRVISVAQAWKLVWQAYNLCPDPHTLNNPTSEGPTHVITLPLGVIYASESRRISAM